MSVSSAPFLERFRLGADKPVLQGEIPEPVDLDREKFRRGQRFFQDNIICCSFFMAFSLICGLSVREFLDVLVATGESSSQRKAGYRYFKTYMYILKWHLQDVWDKPTEAYKSIQAVRGMHHRAYKMMLEIPDTTQMYVSQYDMAIVQCGFMGSIVLYGPILGRYIKASEIDDYVYFWRWVGYFLGISDEYNICRDGYMSAYFICKDIERDVLLPAMKNPPREYNVMARNAAGIFRYKAVVGFANLMTGCQGPPLSLIDSFAVYCLIMFFRLLELCPPLRRFLNKHFYFIVYRLFLNLHGKSRSKKMN